MHYIDIFAQVPVVTLSWEMSFHPNAKNIFLHFGKSKFPQTKKEIYIDAFDIFENRLRLTHIRFTVKNCFCNIHWSIIATHVLTH